MSTPGGFSSATGGGGGGGGRGRGGGGSGSGGENEGKQVAVLVIQVESPNVLYVRKTPLSAEERSFLRAMAEYCSHLNAASSSSFSSSSSSGWRASLSDRRLSVGKKYLALDSRPGGSEWRRALLTNVVTVRGGHRYIWIAVCVYCCIYVLLYVYTVYVLIRVMSGEGKSHVITSGSQLLLFIVQSGPLNNVAICFPLSIHPSIHPERAFI